MQVNRGTHVAPGVFVVPATPEGDDTATGWQKSSLLIFSAKHSKGRAGSRAKCWVISAGVTGCRGEIGLSGRKQRGHACVPTGAGAREGRALEAWRSEKWVRGGTGGVAVGSLPEKGVV